jgi:two-component system, NtrC family, response regulator AtoC
LEEEMRQERFREDLYYRMDAFSVYVPALRERGDDLDLLAAYFLSHYALREGRRVEGFTHEALECLRHYGFPGNIRELQNIVHRAVVFCRGRAVDVTDLPERLRKRRPASGSGEGEALFAEKALLPIQGPYPSMEEMKVRYTRYLLEKMDGNKRRTAALLGIGRKTLYRYIQD